MKGVEFSWKSCVLAGYRLACTRESCKVDRVGTMRTTWGLAIYEYVGVVVGSLWYLSKRWTIPRCTVCCCKSKVVGLLSETQEVMLVVFVQSKIVMKRDCVVSFVACWLCRGVSHVIFCFYVLVVRVFAYVEFERWIPTASLVKKKRAWTRHKTHTRRAKQHVCAKTHAQHNTALRAKSKTMAFCPSIRHIKQPWKLARW